MLEIQLYQPAFDWGAMDEDTRVFLLEKTEHIRACLKRTADDILAIGEDLLEVKARLPRGQFLGWLETEFDLSEDTAERWMNIAGRLGDKFRTMRNYPMQVVYALASRTTPPEVVDRVISGEIPVSLEAIREAKASYAPSSSPTLPVYDPEPEAVFIPNGSKVFAHPGAPTPLYEPNTIALPPELDFVADLASLPAPKEAGFTFLELMGKINRLYEAINEFESLHDDEINAGLQRMSLADQERHAILLRMVRNWANALEARMHRNPEKPFTVIHSEGE